MRLLGVRVLEEMLSWKRRQSGSSLHTESWQSRPCVRTVGRRTTIVGYANDGLVIYFLILRTSQKFANIQHDDRVSVAIGEEPRDLREAKAVFAGAQASEVTDPKQRDHAWRLLVKRHPNLADFLLPASSEAAMMRAVCRYVSIVDYSKGLGHSDGFTIEDV